ncbi:4Fe-4S dicluster domain-containing protein [Vibrio lentus]|nr:4Fe-4S dicluster domain-containing protein [Vibrio lentus]
MCRSLPASLLPQQLQWHARKQQVRIVAEELNIKDCIECGACAFVCPSEIPLVQYYRQAKAEIKTRKDEATAAERARFVSKRKTLVWSVTKQNVKTASKSRG